MRNIIWRNRASAILGLMIMLLAFINGFPDGIKTFFFIVLGGLIALFGFTSNRYASELGEEGYLRRNKHYDEPVPSSTPAESFSTSESELKSAEITREE